MIPKHKNPQIGWFIFSVLFLWSGRYSNAQSHRALEVARSTNVNQVSDETTHNPVIVIHGILGSKLVDKSSKKTVWGLAANDADKVLKELLPDVADEPTRCRIAEDHLAKCSALIEVLRDPKVLRSQP